MSASHRWEEEASRLDYENRELRAALDAANLRVAGLEASLRRLQKGEGGAGLRLSAHMEGIIRDALEPRSGDASGSPSVLRWMLVEALGEGYKAGRNRDGHSVLEAIADRILAGGGK